LVYALRHCFQWPFWFHLEQVIWFVITSWMELAPRRERWLVIVVLVSHGRLRPCYVIILVFNCMIFAWMTKKFWAFWDAKSREQCTVENCASGVPSKPESFAEIFLHKFESFLSSRNIAAIPVIQ
jgi:hypothetical protein